MTALIIVWLICGIVGALIAQTKNRRPWVGALLGGALGLVGILIVACLPRLPRVIPSP